ncbi:MAG: hydrogenase iron-sulfur subunit [Candidatus Helarchaeota archaeon]|nr:hydrogenase iron-sulfur subunit [Candidatus Helarchaeota archaeon]
MSDKEFSPKIVTFLCNWCGYGAADLAGVSRFQYPTTIRIIRVMCSGRIQPSLILNAFRKGSDGILICGCHPGDCHYISGNEKAEERIQQTKKLLDLLAIEPERLRLEWTSSAEGAKFAKVIKDFSNQIASLGAFEIKVEEVKIEG